MSKIKGILITPNMPITQPRVQILEVGSYEDYYPLIDCECFDIQTRNFNGHWLDIYCDDEGLFKENNQVAILTINNNGKVVEAIVGNVFIVGHNEEGETISLTQEEIDAVLSTVCTIQTPKSNGPYKVCVAKC